MSIKTLTEILGLSLELKDYEDRVQKRYDYIQEQLEKDPDFVGYDHIEYWDGKVDIHYFVTEWVVGTDGSLIHLETGKHTNKKKRKNKNFYTSRSLKTNYKVFNFKIHRILASTYIPKPEHLTTLPFWTLDVNHKNGVKDFNSISNLEWCTHKENVIHACKLGLVPRTYGLENPTSKPLLGKIIVPGPFNGIKFAMFSDRDFEEIGLNPSNARMTVLGKRNNSDGCLWKEVSKEESLLYPHKPPEGYVDFYKENMSKLMLRTKPVLGIGIGKNSGIPLFCFIGKDEIRNSGFSVTSVFSAARNRGMYKNIRWKYITLDEAWEIKSKGQK